LWDTEIIFLSSPIFFYGMPGQTKSLVDRSQALWSKRMLEKSPEGRKKYDHGRGYLIAVGATKGKNLFEGTELTAKYFFDSYRYLSWQSEYMVRHMNLNFGTDPAPDDPNQALNTFGKDLTQSGFYSQLVYRFAQRWRIGARYDRFTQNDVYINGLIQDTPGDLDRISAMLEFKPTEFSTFRLQFNRDNSLFDGSNREPVNSVFLQFNMAIGAHGAHAY